MLLLLLILPALGLAEDMYLYPGPYERATKRRSKCTVNASALHKTIEANRDRIQEADHVTIDLNDDGICEILFLPLPQLVGTGGLWYDIYELKKDIYKDIGSISTQFTLGEARNGYARIIQYSGYGANPVFSAQVLYYSGNGYELEYRGGHSRGYYMDGGLEAYNQGNYLKAERYYWNAYRLNDPESEENRGGGGADSRLLDANNLALPLIKLGKLDEAEQIIKRHLDRSVVTEYRAAGFFNLGMIYEKRGNCEKALQFYTESGRLFPAASINIRIEKMMKCTH